MSRLNPTHAFLDNAQTLRCPARVFHRPFILRIYPKRGKAFFLSVTAHRLPYAYAYDIDIYGMVLQTDVICIYKQRDFNSSALRLRKD